MIQSSFQFKPSYLTSINPTSTAIKIGCGAIVWLAIRTATYYGTRGLFSECILEKDGALDEAAEDAKEYFGAMTAEHVVSCAFSPVRYLAGITAPRYLLDYMLTWLSDYICVFDRFSPAEYASFSVFAFESGDEEWSLAFFSWQMPAVCLNVLKLIYRRYKFGPQQTKTFRVLGVIGIQVMVRAYLSSFSVILPDSGRSAMEAIIGCFLDSMATRYLIWHTSPFYLPKEERSGK